MCCTYEKSRKSLPVGPQTGLEDQFKHFFIVVDVYSFMCNEEVECDRLMCFSHGTGSAGQAGNQQQETEQGNCTLCLFVSQGSVLVCQSACGQRNDQNKKG